MSLEFGKAWLVLRKPHGTDRLDEFLAFGFVAIGWPDRDFTGMSYDELWRDLKEYHQETDPSLTTKRAKAVQAFVNDIKVGHLVCVPAGADVYVGHVVEPYRHVATFRAEGYSNQLGVQWLREPIPWLAFPKSVQGKLRMRFPIVSPLGTELQGVVRQAQVKLQAASRVGKGRKLPKRRPIGNRPEGVTYHELANRSYEIKHLHNQLVRSFRDFVGHRWKLAESLYDVIVLKWRPDRDLLIEAKSHAKGWIGRQQIREAVGQLYDYQDMLQEGEHKITELALLLPAEPDADIMRWVNRKLGIEIIWQEGDKFNGTKGVQPLFG